MPSWFRHSTASRFPFPFFQENHEKRKGPYFYNNGERAALALLQQSKGVDGCGEFLNSFDGNGGADDHSSEGLSFLKGISTVCNSCTLVLMNECPFRIGVFSSDRAKCGALDNAPLLENTRKMNFYLSAVNDILRHRDDQPSIGLILCKTRDRVVAEYALRDVSKPIGVSEYQLAAALPDKLKGTLPTIEDLESELSNSLESDSGDIRKA